jgi:hypothetical protein
MKLGAVKIQGLAGFLMETWKDHDSAKVPPQNLFFNPSFSAFLFNSSVSGAGSE